MVHEHQSLSPPLQGGIRAPPGFQDLGGQGGSGLVGKIEFLCIWRRRRRKIWARAPPGSDPQNKHWFVGLVIVFGIAFKLSELGSDMGVKIIMNENFESEDL